MKVDERYTAHPINRRTMIAGGTAGLLAAGFPHVLRAGTLHGGQAWPSARLSGPQAADRVAAEQFMPTRQLRAWYEQLDDIGLRATGSKRHEAYLDTLQARMHQVGLTQVAAEPVSFERWSPEEWSLDIVEGAQAGAVPVSSYIPYSGFLRPEGLAFPLMYVPLGVTPAAGTMAGKIILFEVTIPRGTLPTMLGRMAHGSYGPASELDPKRPFARVFFGDARPRIAAMRACKPAAMIAVLPLDNAAAAGMYLPFDGIIREAPGLFVAQEQGAKLKAAAQAGVKVRVKLSAKQERFASRNLLGVIPGRSEEVVVLHSHTDGPNGIEDNGPDLILAMAQYLGRIPKALLPRSVMVLLTTGHFAGGIGSQNFISRHREDLLPRIAAAVTVEHVGAMEMALKPDGSFYPTGLPEPGIVFMPPAAETLQQQVHRGLEAGGFPATFLGWPVNPTPRTVTDLAWPAEGQYLWNNGGVPAANYTTGPNYLFSADFKTAPLVDYEMMRREAIGFTDLALALMRVSADSLKVAPPPDMPVAGVKS